MSKICCNKTFYEILLLQQDNSSATTLHHLNLLPKKVQHNLLVTWNRDGRYRDMEDVLQSVAHDPDCSEMVKNGMRLKFIWGLWKKCTYNFLIFVCAIFICK